MAVAFMLGVHLRGLVCKRPRFGGGEAGGRTCLRAPRHAADSDVRGSTSWLGLGTQTWGKKTSPRIGQNRAGIRKLRELIVYIIPPLAQLAENLSHPLQNWPISPQIGRVRARTTELAEVVPRLADIADFSRFRIKFR